MDLYSVVSNTSHGFNANIAIDRKMFKDKIPFTTEAKPVEGMPDVKWYLKFCHDEPSYNNYFVIYLWLESEKKVQCKISGFARTRDGSTSNRTERQSFCKFYGQCRIINLIGLFLGVSGVNGRGISFKVEPRCYILDPTYNYLDENEKYQIEIQVSISYKDEQPPRICNPTELCERLQETSDEDFHIHVSGEIFAIHKFLIAAESTVFKRMFEDKFKEAKEGKVKITDFKVQVVKAFVHYCYGRVISTDLQDESDEIQLLYFADKYDCQSLKPQMESFHAKKLSKENISFYVSTADKTNALQLRQACVQFVQTLYKKNERLPEEVLDGFDKAFYKDIFLSL